MDNAKLAKGDKEAAMMKFYTLVGAIVVFAPFSLVALAQAARIVA